MASIIQHLIPESQKLITAIEAMSVQAALELMIEHNYSQLPVVDQNNKVKGLITSDSILRALCYFQTTIDRLNVSHATIRTKVCRADDDLSELLNGLRDTSAVPVVNKTGELVALVTDYDTAEYYRQRAEDLMLAEDIETTIRDLIESAYKDQAGNVDDAALKNAIQNITPSGKDLKNKFQKGLLSYIQQSGMSFQKPDAALLDQVFAKHLFEPIEAKSFEALALSEYIQLFKNLWEKYQPVFNQLEWNAIGKLLDEVRQTRNAIAHFREVTPNQRKQMKFCYDLLERHRLVETEPEPVATLVLDEKLTLNITASDGEAVEELEEAVSPVEEELGSNESRYAPLALWLQSQDKLDRIALTFDQVEEIINDKLPSSARAHRNWWANDSVGHTQSQQWLDVSWRVANVNLTEERVTFSRMGERQSAYIDFFNTLLPKLQAIPDLRVQPAMNAQGRHWYTVKVASANQPDSMWISFSFARRSRFRIETYIETGDRQTNKQIFDHLHRQATEIETQLGEPLSWERLDLKRASRIALYREGSAITHSAEALLQIQDWAIDRTSRFYWAIAAALQAAVRSPNRAS